MVDKMIWVGRRPVRRHGTRLVCRSVQGLDRHKGADMPTVVRLPAPAMATHKPGGRVLAYAADFRQHPMQVIQVDVIGAEPLQ